VPTDYEGALRFIEMAGRTCYRSEDKITPEPAGVDYQYEIAALGRSDSGTERGRDVAGQG